MDIVDRIIEIGNIATVDMDTEFIVTGYETERMSDSVLSDVKEWLPVGTIVKTIEVNPRNKDAVRMCGPCEFLEKHKCCVRVQRIDEDPNAMGWSCYIKLKKI